MDASTNACVDAAVVREELERILSSRIFAAAGRSRLLLPYVVERSLAGAAPKEYEIAVEVLGRDASYDPEINATVRVEAGRLRQRLREYYEGAAPGPVRIEVPKGGYAAVFRQAAVELPPVASVQAAATPLAEIEARAAVERRQPSIRVAFTWLLLGAGLLAFVLVLAVPSRNQHLQASGPIRSLAVLPLKDLSGGTDQAYFAEGMTDALITDLAQTPNLRVVSRTSAMQMGGTTKTLKQIASALDVEAVVEGTVVRSGGRIRITAQLIDARDDRHLWAESFEESAGDVLALQDKVAREIAVRTQTILASSRGPAPKAMNPAAYDAYLRGVYFLHRREILRSVAYLQQAVSLEPTYAEAHAQLAQALASEVLLLNDPAPDAEAQARLEAGRAIELDPNCGEAYAALSQVEINYRKDWKRAGENLSKSLALNPNDSMAEMLTAVYFDAMREPEQAVDAMRRAVKLDPLSFFMNRHLGSALYFDRRYDEAIDALHRAAEMEPHQVSLVDNWLSRSFEMRGDLRAAKAADTEALKEAFPPQELLPLQQAYERGGWEVYQLARARLFAAHPKLLCGQFEAGESYLRIGDLDRAFAAFDQGMSFRCFWQDSLAVNPTMDRVRADPRYAGLLRRANLM